MTQDDIDNGRLICVIGVAPVQPGRVRHLSYRSEDYSLSPNVISELPEMTATYCLPSTA